MTDRLRHYLPADPIPYGIRIDGEPDWSPIWDPELNRYTALVMQEVVFDFLKRGERIRILPGFDFDGMTAPDWTWMLVGSPFTTRFLMPALMHDGVYASELFPRSQCDAMMDEVSEAVECNPVKRKLVYGAVRSFGWTVWRDHKPEETERYRKLVILERIPVAA